MAVQSQPGQIDCKPYLENTQPKKGWWSGVAQVVEHMPIEQEVLSKKKDSRNVLKLIKRDTENFQPTLYLRTKDRISFSLKWKEPGMLTCSPFTQDPAGGPGPMQ
jgi:hypothetical protein